MNFLIHFRCGSPQKIKGIKNNNNNKKSNEGKKILISSLYICMMHMNQATNKGTVVYIILFIYLLYNVITIEICRFKYKIL